jgi:hypothetical protein
MDKEETKQGLKLIHRVTSSHPVNSSKELGV